ncbi:MAG: class I SAM-dependent methyltransferase [Candidatus Heimdallarchaeaceae archaeon]|jgi:tRNA wybutosine-synthesizing protein 2
MKIKKKLQELLSDKLDTILLEKIPSGYSVIGDIAVFHHIDNQLESKKELIGNLVIELDPKVNVVVEQIRTKTEFRKPEIVHLAGEKRTETFHLEYKTKFNLDIAEITFSPGNKGERGHLIKTIKDNEIICDMFACIGNLSLPLTVNIPTVEVYGIEINQIAFNYLKNNIMLNKVENNYYPTLGDNREKTPDNIADRVLMGYFNIDDKQFSKAVKALNSEGWIHYHYTAVRNFEKEIEDFFIRMKKELKFKLEDMIIRRIKKFSPRLNHYCADIKITK